jgi:hypothetical protein
MPDAIQYTAPSSEIADAIEDARRWHDRADACDRIGYLADYLVGQAEAALERADYILDGSRLTVVGDITPLLREEP